MRAATEERGQSIRNKLWKLHLKQLRKNRKRKPNVTITMGEVKVKVLLTNAADEAFARRKKIGLDEVRTYEAEAMIDTGAVQTVIPADVARQLGLETPRQRGIEYADGRKEIVPVTEAIVIEIRNRATNDEALVLGDEVLIGQTILEKLDLHVDCANQKVIPNPAHPDQAITKVK